MRKLGLVLAGVVVGGLVALQVPSGAQTSTPDGTQQRTITATGSATVHAKPDEAIVSLGVHTQADTAQAAMDQNASKMNAVLQALKGLGLGDADLATTNISLDPMWSNTGSSIVGYQAENTVDATVHDLSKVGKTIDEAVAAGANLTGGITFRLSDQNQGLNAALADAVRDAKSKADAMAAAAGSGVGAVVTIAQANAQEPNPYAERVSFAAAADASTPVNTPTIENEVQVTVTWALQ
jgi:uncharacterized protein YggE